MSKTNRILFRTIAAAVLLLLLLFWDDCGWWPIPSICGQAQARLDLARGRYQLLGYGRGVGGRNDYTDLLRQRYGVEFRAVAGCIVSKSTVEYANAYDAAVKSAVNRKFGRDVFAEAHAEADRIWKQRHPDAANSAVQPRR